MAWTTLGTAVAGDVLTASYFNGVLRSVESGLPIVTTTERNALSSPSTGTEVYNSTTGSYEMYTGSGWEISRPFRMQSGSIDVTTSLSISSGPFNGGFYNSAGITFDSGRFSQAPIVTLSGIKTTACFAYIISAATTSGVTIGVVGELNAVHPVQYHAVQMTSAAGSG
jgi:hypothetical protein